MFFQPPHSLQSVICFTIRIITIQDKGHSHIRMGHNNFFLREWRTWRRSRSRPELPEKQNYLCAWQKHLTIKLF